MFVINDRYLAAPAVVAEREADTVYWAEGRLSEPYEATLSVWLVPGTGEG